jgi:spermidine synthase
VHHDHVATTISRGYEMHRQLLVDGVGIAALTPVTKYMAHLPLAFHQGKAESMLIICFGMGTSFRSALSWNVETTAIELVPGVKDAFGYYHADASYWVNHPKGRIVVDDGRRYLKRIAEKFDVISFDTPSSVIQVAGSGLLYSEELYELVKRRLKPGGILQVWWPVGGETQSAVARSISKAFPHTLALPPIAGGGVHFLASMEPFDHLNADELLARIPASARRDLLEWDPNGDLKSGFENMLTNRLSVEEMLSLHPHARITDDRPFNEYYLLRDWGIFSPD